MPPHCHIPGSHFTLHRNNVAKFANSEMCRLTEKVIFSEPYTVASNNNYLPHLEADVKELQADTQAKVCGGGEEREGMAVRCSAGH